MFPDADDPHSEFDLIKLPNDGTVQIGDDEEVWLVQLPKDVNIATSIEHKDLAGVQKHFDVSWISDSSIQQYVPLKPSRQPGALAVSKPFSGRMVFSKKAAKVASTEQLHTSDWDADVPRVPADNPVYRPLPIGGSGKNVDVVVGKKRVSLPVTMDDDPRSDAQKIPSLPSSPERSDSGKREREHKSKDKVAKRSKKESKQDSEDGEKSKDKKRSGKKSSKKDSEDGEKTKDKKQSGKKELKKSKQKGDKKSSSSEKEKHSKKHKK